MTTVLVAAVLSTNVGPAVADHVSARDISTACPAEHVGSRSEGYTDVKDSVFEREIACVSDYRVALGTGDGRYAPEGTVSRAQMARFLARLAQNLRLPLLTDHAEDFDDTRHLDAATRNAISAVRALGITYGVSPQRFAPAAPVTRAQMAGFLARVLERRHVPVTDPAYAAFDDDNGSVLEYEIASIASHGIATGLGGEQHRLFAPGRTLTRGQMAGFLARTLDVAVDQGVAGSPYVPRETVEGPVLSFSHDLDLVVLDADQASDGPDARDPYLYVDPNDEVRFGERAATSEELLAALTAGDRFRVDYAPNYFESSTWTVLDDHVLPPSALLATALVGDDGVQDDVRVAWTAPDSDDGVVERLRGSTGDDGRCGTEDDSPYAVDGTVEGERGTTALPFPHDPDPANPVVVDADRGDGCYRYTVRSVSERLPGSTPSGPSQLSNAVRVGGEPDTTAPALTRAERAPEAEDDDHPRVVRYSFADETFVRPALERPDFPNYDALALECAFESSPSYVQALLFFRAEGSTLLGAQAFGEHVPTCDQAIVQPVGVVDERGNPNLEQMRVPFDSAL